MLNNGRVGQIYNVSSGVELSNNEIVEKILLILNKPSYLIEYVNDRLGHDYRYGTSTLKIEKELNWKAKHNFNLIFPAFIKKYINL